ncbi:hypothetical protein [Rhodococcoides fascians]|uniref:hypothetical protein n=1 Tax=Rhodococcoides fascians TaxID=1828 RepID=UPI000A82977C|nr:hypothetical protein [Rhodococcus fascians]
MPAMLGNRHGGWWWVQLMPHRQQRRDVARGRRKEDREWRRSWIDEYEPNPALEHRFCPKGGDLCRCDGLEDY